ncbi:hypothetical protein BD293_0063 [Roseinatronobacter monicus]|uniref:Uncharacterized protein n=1 Tax=Roseinatronobacter monicus TaxID=393481 RepID=A0A543K8U9_9RHOB|nr:hypothetical protein BD293_0063 [Roseinatronobacter monicus]
MGGGASRALRVRQGTGLPCPPPERPDPALSGHGAAAEPCGQCIRSGMTSSGGVWRGAGQDRESGGCMAPPLSEQGAGMQAGAHAAKPVEAESTGTAGGALRGKIADRVTFRMRLPERVNEALGAKLLHITQLPAH